MKRTGSVIWSSLVLLSILAAAGCSTTRNTASSRLYQSAVTRFNAYFNGQQAYDKGYAAQEKDKKDNMLEIPDMFPISDSKLASTGKKDFDLAIEKAQKCIKLHSITAKPKKKSGRTMTEKEKAWQAKNEYNPYLWHAWMLMADAQAQEGEFLEAASTYSYISKLYSDEPEISAQALSKMAWCYAHLDWYYEAEELFARSGQTKTGIQDRMWHQARRASALLRQQRYEESIPLLEEAVARKGTSKTQRIREMYLLGQLYKATGNNEAAQRAFGKVIRMSPPYDIEFHARIRQTETMADGSGTRAVMKKLRRMERDPKNKQRIDQIYYAMGNVHMLQNDTLKALELYETGVEKTESKTPEKGILLLTMANLYWDMAEYERAGECYSEAVGMIGSTHKDYATVKLRSEVLEELSGYVSAVNLQDSLQMLATLPDSQVTVIIDRVIEELKQKEAEEAEKQALEQEKKGRTGASGNSQDAGDSDGQWYFYNSRAIERGRQEFLKQWGERKLEDDWRRQNKSVLATLSQADGSGTNGSGTASDSITADTMTIMADTMVIGSVSNDPHTREYHLARIPRTDEAIEKSNSTISASLLGAGIIYKDRLSEYGRAEESLQRIVRQYPDHDEADDAAYNLYLMYSLWEKPDMADSCRAIMQERYPDSELTTMVCDPDYIDNARFGRHREDSIYAETYNAFRAGDTATVRLNCRISESTYPKGQNRAKFMFLNAATDLQNGNLESFMAQLSDLVKKYPKEEIGQFAGLIAQGVQDGRILQSTSFSSIWDRQNGMGSGKVVADSLKPQFSTDRNQSFLFILAYPQGEINENQLLFEIASYNFSNYMMRNFDLSFSNEQGIGMMTVSEFMNFDEAYTYSRKLYSDAEMARKLEGLKALTISKKNLETLLKYYSINEWLQFYEENFLAIPDFEIDGTTLFEEPE